MTPVARRWVVPLVAAIAWLALFAAAGGSAVAGIAASSGSASSLLKAGYRAARSQHSFELSWSPLLPALYWVIQTPGSTRAVERYQIGAPIGYVYTLLSPRRACFWNQRGAPSAAAAQCSAESLTTYDAEVFPFLDLEHPVLAGTRRVDGARAEGVRGRLVMRTRQGTSTSSFSVGLVTAWFAARDRLPLVITCSSRGCAGVPVVATFSHWDSPTVRFPPGTPGPGGPTKTTG